MSRSSDDELNRKFQGAKKMKYKRSRGLFRTSSIILSLTLLITLSMSGQRECCQANLWLKWTHDEREGYVSGYSIGYSAGYGSGCEQGTKDWPITVKGNVEDFPLNKCISKQPDFSKGSEFLIRAVTDFYNAYPSDRDIYINEILDQLGRGLTPQEIHNHQFPRHQAVGRRENR